VWHNNTPRKLKLSLHYFISIDVTEDSENFIHITDMKRNLQLSELTSAICN